MKAKIKVKVEIDLKILAVKAGVRYWELQDKNIPCKIGEDWCPIIEIDTGKILNWKQDVKAEIHYKVTDRLSYEIKDENEKVVLSAKDVYVPNTLSPKERGYGDYIIMDIDENGQIADWEFDISDFENSNDDLD